MSELPQLISDLALILIVAGLTTIVFKRLKQPLVLGYILAGFLAGPHMPYTPSIEEIESIEVWSQIGVIFLMFSLGLEFSFKKILKGGASPIIAACFIMSAMWGMGCGAGYLMGWTPINCMFVGGMLAMSSTTIIYKAFDDMGLMSRRFAGKVMSVLILEDILGIVVMVLLSAVAVSNKLQGGELIASLLKLGFFLLLWFLVGMWAIPTFLHRNRSFINKETLVIVSIGLCFLMVVVADSVGYSSALGAFMMGSILAETLEAERIDSAISSLKDLFGAIFFVSVGMMVSPADLVAHWLPIVVLVVTILIGQAVFGTMGYLFSGSSRSDALMSGFSMAQIGEFAFIIAALGQSLGVTEGFLMPIVVATSIITTFLTPYMIKLGARLTSGRPIPGRPSPSPSLVGSGADAADSQRDLLTTPLPTREGPGEGLSGEGLPGKSLPGKSRLGMFLRKVFLSTLVYGVLSVAVVSLLFVSLLLACRQIFGHWVGNAVCGVLVLLLLAPLLRPMVMKYNGSDEANRLRRKGFLGKSVVNATIVVRFLFAVDLVFYIIEFLSPFRWYFHVAVAVLVVFSFIRSKFVRRVSMKMEQTFMENLTRRENSGPAYARKLQGRDLHIARLTLPEGSTWAGKTLAQLRIGGRSGVHVAAIVRDHHRLNVPGGQSMLFPHDVLEVVGNDDSIERLRQRMSAETERPAQDEGDLMQLLCMEVGHGSPLAGTLVKDSGIRATYRCMVVGVEDPSGNIRTAGADHEIRPGDKMWLAGSHDELMRLKQVLTLS
ncbi:MAG: cation:proton antiporter [Bacteroidaceae bacterium]|nr:cation:proton antiporter [Bacteroidaceae bacterium]